MSSPRALRLNVFAAALSALLAAVSALELVGHTARLVDVILLLAGGVGAGAGIAGAVASVWKARQAGV
ncbi:MAG TPA: hypothetical protein VFH27_13400 [Longimicrobiaceae bacterium]|nr:hypothetical protein [Longimicrobiaceae bacterium]